MLCYLKFLIPINSKKKFRKAKLVKKYIRNTIYKKRSKISLFTRKFLKFCKLVIPRLDLALEVYFIFSFLFICSIHIFVDLSLLLFLPISVSFIFLLSWFIPIICLYQLSCFFSIFLRSGPYLICSYIFTSTRIKSNYFNYPLE